MAHRLAVQFELVSHSKGNNLEFLFLSVVHIHTQEDDSAFLVDATSELYSSHALCDHGSVHPNA